MNMVNPEGFEPPTNRTGICHSIQLNYGSSFWICCANVLLSVKCEFWRAVFYAVGRRMIWGLVMWKWLHTCCMWVSRMMSQRVVSAAGGVCRMLFKVRAKPLFCNSRGPISSMIIDGQFLLTAVVMIVCARWNAFAEKRYRPICSTLVSVSFAIMENVSPVCMFWKWRMLLMTGDRMPLMPLLWAQCAAMQVVLPVCTGPVSILICMPCS